MNAAGAMALLAAGGAAEVANLFDYAAEHPDLSGSLLRRLRTLGATAEHLRSFSEMFEEAGITEASVRSYVSGLEDEIRKREDRHVTHRDTGLQLRWDIAAALQESTSGYKRRKKSRAGRKLSRDAA